MEITPFSIYLWSLLDRILNLSAVGAVASLFIFLVVGRFVYECAGDEADEKLICKKICWFSGLSFFLFVSLLIFVPNQKTFALMVIVPKIINSEAVQKDAPEIYSLAIKALKEKLAPAGEK